MIYHVALVAAAYVGNKIYRAYKEQLHQPVASPEPDSYEVPPLDDEAPNEEQQLDEALDLQSNVVLKSELQTQQVEQELESLKQQEQAFTHYAKTSFASAALMAGKSLVPGVGVVGFATYVYSVLPYMREVEKSIRKDKKLNVDTLFLGADMLTLGIGQFATAGASLWLSYSGKLSVLRAKDDSQKMISGIFADLPTEVWLLDGNIERKVKLEQIKPGDVVVVHAGEMIPIDGIIKMGLVSIDQHALTGEAQPAEKGEGEAVFANTMVLTGHAQILVEKSGEMTTSAKIGEVLLNATEHKSQTQLKGELWAEKATTPITLASLAAWPLLGARSAVVISNSHIGRRIRMLAPMATLSQLTLAAHEGILVKDGRVLENLHQVDTLVFDKTGTLTTGEPLVAKVYAVPGRDEHQIIQLAATAEQKQSHPIATAIMAAAKSLDIEPLALEGADYKIGFGLRVQIGGKTIKVGSKRYLSNEKIALGAYLSKQAKAAETLGNTMIYVAIDDKAAGAIELVPQIRPEVPEVLQALKEMGIKNMVIVSGDQEEATARLAHDLGMSGYFAQVLPENKADIVALLQEQGHNVCFVGDGINDTIAMKQANASISLSGATGIATDIAEVVLMDGTLNHLPQTFELSKKLDDNLRHILTMAIAPGVINVVGSPFKKYSIFTSLAVNFVSVGIAMFRIKAPLGKIEQQERAKLKEQQKIAKRETYELQHTERQL